MKSFNEDITCDILNFDEPANNYENNINQNKNPKNTNKINKQSREIKTHATGADIMSWIIVFS